MAIPNAQSAPSDSVVLRFAEFELDAGTRVLRHVNDVKPMEPLPFDLLLYLIKHRQRVVTKEELAKVIWARDFVSSACVARAVMKVRHSIEDSASEGFIRTVPRVGYQFVADVKETQSQPAARPANTPSAATGTKGPMVAVLPFTNSVGDPRLDWIRLGLMSVLTGHLAATHRVSVAPTETVLSSPPPELPTAPRNEVVSALCAANGWTHAVEVDITRSPAGFVATITLHAKGEQHTRKVADAALEALPRAITQEVVGIITGERIPTLLSHHDDLLATQALSRAMQALMNRQWRAAANLFRVVLDMEPHNFRVQIEYLHALASLNDPACAALGQRLLDIAESTGDHESSAAVRRALGKMHLKQGKVAIGRSHLDKALALSSQGTHQGDTLETLELLFKASLSQNDFAEAESYAQKVRALSETSKCHNAAVSYANLCAMLADRREEYSHSLEHSREMHRLAKEKQVVATRASRDWYTAASASVHLGLIKEAAANLQGHLDQAIEDRHWHRASRIAAMHACISQEQRLPSRVETAMELITSRADPLALCRPSIWTAHGFLCLANRRFPEAAEHLGRAIEQWRRDGIAHDEHIIFPWYVISLIQAGLKDKVAEELATSRGIAYRRDMLLQNGVMYCDAMNQHAQGKVDTAVATLDYIVKKSKPRLVKAWACMDLAWLHAEGGRRTLAQQTLRELGPWQHTHPFAHAVRARIAFAAGDFADALACHDQYFAEIESDQESAYMHELRDAYASAASGHFAEVRLRNAPVLPSRV